MEKIMDIEFGRLPENTTLVDETFYNQNDSEDSKITDYQLSKWFCIFLAMETPIPGTCLLYTSPSPRDRG